MASLINVLIIVPINLPICFFFLNILLKIRQGIYTVKEISAYADPLSRPSININTI